jgi:hypothetical protein
MKTSSPIPHFRSPIGGQPPFGPHASRLTPHAFTLIEILTSVALLSFIVIGLFAMFNQTQRAFRVGMTQSDILEAGRAVTEMIPRELEQITPSARNAINFTAAMILSEAPLIQPLPNDTTTTKVARTNFLEDLFMLQRQNQTWVGIGYFVRVADTNGALWYPESKPGKPGEPGTLGAGSLYRFMATLPYLYSGNPSDPRNGLPQDPLDLYRAWLNAGQPGVTNPMPRICDGVIHFRVRAFATNGFPLFSDGLHTNACFRTNSLNPLDLGYTVVRQTYVTPNALVPPTFSYPDNLATLYFSSNAVPAAVELELGLLEQYTWERYASIGNPVAAFNFLQREETSTRVHLFRQRIPIRNVDPLPYQ